MDYERTIAIKLVEACNKDPQRESYAILLKTVYPEYVSGERDGCVCLDLDHFEAFNLFLEDGIQKQLFASKKDSKAQIYRRITASEKQIQQLASRNGLTLKKDYLEQMRTILKQHEHSECPQLQEWIAAQLEQEKLADVCKWFRYQMETGTEKAACALTQLIELCEAVFRLQEDVLMRNFSASQGLGSKGLDEKLQNRICAIMAPEQHQDEQKPAQILRSLHILQNPASVWMKGNGRILFQNGDRISCANRSPIALTREWVEQIQRVEAKDLLTIENLTTFNDYQPQESEFVVFTSGFANSLVVEFLKRCISDNGRNSFRHFGDLDAFGFQILKNLSTRTQLAVTPYQMDLSVYEANREQAIPITKGNQALFKKLLQDPFFSKEQKQLFQLLLQEGKILEQEGIQANKGKRSI